MAAAVLSAASRAAMGDGRRIPLVGFGTYLLSAEETKTAVLEALRAGYRHLDTAEGYRTEPEVGEALRASGLSREEVFVTSKVFPGNAEWKAPAKGFDACIAACEASLERLGTDYLDLYLIHGPFCRAERLDQWRALLELQRRGRCRSVGVSNYAVAHLEEIREAGLPMPAANQIELHPFCAQQELCRYMAGHSILPIAYSSLAPLAGWRQGQPSGKAARGAGVLDGELPFGELAARHGVGEAQVLLRWALQKGYPVLPKSATPERIRQNLDLFGFELGQEDMAAMDGLDRGLAVAWEPLDPVSVL
mmetsp:Transcript_56104/g.173883  ORF Transcript_56104/g.173883 Transcript_56104/m.173883 type:complete len:306 (+) Transcript_56104:2-919(+)